MLATRNLEEDIELKPRRHVVCAAKPNIKNTALFPHLEPVIRLNSSIGFREMLWKKVLTNAALFVLPSDLEGLSLALPDAMGAGVCAGQRCAGELRSHRRHWLRLQARRYR